MTGIVEEFLALRDETDADLLAMQVGDFYEFFAEDARTVADELDLKVSEKSSHGSSYPMAGVPVDDLTPYLARLVERGYRVAVADQREDGDGHERAVVRVATPGTLLETGGESARYLASVVAGEERIGVAFVDVTTGRFVVTEVDDESALFTELYRFAPVEMLPGPGAREGHLGASLRERVDATVTEHDSEAFAPGRATSRLREQFGEGALESVGVERGGPGARAAGAAVDYVAETGTGVLASLTRIQPYRADDHVELDATTRRNLELVETMSEGGRSLFETVDHTETAAGRRLLREWLGRPRQSIEELERRQDAVEALAGAALVRSEVRETLGETYDLARQASRAAGGSADARDLLQVRDTLARLPDLEEAVAAAPRLADSPVADLLARPDREAAADLRAALDEALVEDPPGATTEGGLFRKGYDDDLDDLIDRHEELEAWLADLERDEKERLGITHLQVGRNKTDGYYLQVGNSETDAVPEEYREVKSLKNSTRYTTDDLEETERELLRVEERRADLESRLFADLRARVADRADCLQAVGRALAELDALASLAVHAVENDWTRPEVTRGDALAIEGGRHPVVEQTVEFVPNDARLGGEGDPRFLLVTGPNMSGKSTYMRQVALVVLLAQVGSFVPAASARVGVVDGIFTRVGALDELAQGRSTFMVEMQELSRILHAATDDSLVVLDEVGRGTATDDGISIAWAATEYLSGARATTPSPKVLFATHYHELTTLADHVDGVANAHMAAEEQGEDVTFLRTVRSGPADRSYGIHVAELAGVPDPVVDRAREVLRRLREEQAIDVRGGASEPQQVVFDLEAGELRGARSADGGRTGGDGDGGARDSGGGDEDGGGPGDAALDPEAEAVLAELRDLDVNEVPPVELMARVQEWQSDLEE